MNPTFLQTSKIQAISVWLLSMGLVFSVATQLRLPGLALGPGEVLLLLWLLTTIVLKKRCNPALGGVLTFSFTGALLLSAGYFLTIYPEGHLRPSVIHDTLAYVFCAVLAINYTILPNKYEANLPANLLWAFLFSTLLALALGMIAKDWSGINVMYYETRWQHLANNPNQFALLALPLPFLALYLILRQPKKKTLYLPLFISLLALSLGWYSQSDALALAWIVGGLLATPALLQEQPSYLLSSQTSKMLSWRFTALLIGLIVTGSAWQFRHVALEFISGSLQSPGSIQSPDQSQIENPRLISKAAPCSNLMGDSKSPVNADQNQVSVRLCLWQNALSVIQYAAATGMGPGPHSGFTKPFDGEEAHNTVLDWGTQTGFPGIVLLMGYLAWLFWKVLRTRHYELAAMLLALYSFAMFHMLLRQPLFWIIPLVAVELALQSTDGKLNPEVKE